VQLGDRPFAWRFRVPAGEVRWNDLVLGAIGLDPAGNGGDFVVGRSSRAPAYQLAVVCDDAAMGITQVIRASDLVSSTPRQLLLYQALGLPSPEFGHVGLVLGPDGRRLAKRDQSIKLSTLRANGLDPQRLVGWLARSLGLSDEIEPRSPAHWIDCFETASLTAENWQATNEHLHELTG
jgi:glutamyl-tRNA synthetase